MKDPYEMEIHEEFTKWTVGRGVKINGIRAHKFEGRGLGIIAEKDFEEGDILLTIPLSALRTADTVPNSISKPLLAEKITIHGLLAVDLTLDTSPLRAPWRAVLPSYQSFKSTLPLLWSPSLQSLLPHAAASLLANQKRKLTLDWKHTSSHFPEIKYDDYLHSWCLVNTRTFYYTSPLTSKKRPAPKNVDDCMALLPFGDYSNHSSQPTASASYTKTSYKFSTLNSIRKGEEIYISYGSHSNDFLLAEYGFIMDENEDDSVSLDAVILPLLDETQKKRLEEEKFLGTYVLDSTTKEVCYRTQVALRMICLEAKWRRFVNGSDGGEKDQKVVDELLSKILKGLGNDAEEMARKMDEISGDEAEQRDVLRRRWIQIQGIMGDAIDKLQTEL